jgi:hypothetical protein
MATLGPMAEEKVILKSHRDSMWESTETSEFSSKLRHPTPTDVSEFWGQARLRRSGKRDQ